MKREGVLPVSLAVTALILPVLFFTSVVLADFMGIEAVGAPREAFYSEPRFRTLSRIADVLIVFGPPAAVLLAAGTLFRSWRRAGDAGIAARVGLRSNWIAIAILGVGLALGSIFFTYFILENWNCLLGRQLTC